MTSPSDTPTLPANLTGALLGTAMVVAGYTAEAYIVPAMHGWWQAILVIAACWSIVIVPFLLALYCAFDFLGGRVLRMSGGTSPWVEAALGALPLIILILPPQLASLQHPRTYTGMPVYLETSFGAALMSIAPFVLGLWTGTMTRRLAHAWERHRARSAGLA